MNVLGKIAFVAAMAACTNVFGADAAKANLQVTMLTKVNPQGLALWDITNAALDDNGNVAASKVKPADWAKLIEIGKALEEGGRTLATSDGIIAAAPGAKLQDQANAGASTAADGGHQARRQAAIRAIELAR